MADWNSNKYLAFKNERTQPSIDLVESIELINPKTIIDIGCGPGNSTQILVNKWPNSKIIGLDSSKTMIERAKNDYPNQIWIHEDAQNITDDNKYSLVFSNAALQWIDNHEKLIHNLWKIVENNGAFACQIPNFENMPINIAINNVLNRYKWKDYIDNFWNKGGHELNYYYELLSKYTKELFLWETRYFHILSSMKEIIDFLHSTALKPYLEQLNNQRDREEFEKDILQESKKYYYEQSDGNVLFPFYRMFMIAYKK